MVHQNKQSVYLVCEITCDKFVYLKPLFQSSSYNG
jgi:hypothetical protein